VESVSNPMSNVFHKSMRHTESNLLDTP